MAPEAPDNDIIDVDEESPAPKRISSKPGKCANKKKKPAATKKAPAGAEGDKTLVDDQAPAVDAITSSKDVNMLAHAAHNVVNAKSHSADKLTELAKLETKLTLEKRKTAIEIEAEKRRTLEVRSVLCVKETDLENKRADNLKLELELLRTRSELNKREGKENDYMRHHLPPPPPPPMAYGYAPVDPYGYRRSERSPNRRRNSRSRSPGARSPRARSPRGEGSSRRVSS